MIHLHELFLPSTHLALLCSLTRVHRPGIRSARWTLRRDRRRRPLRRRTPSPDDPSRMDRHGKPVVEAGINDASYGEGTSSDDNGTRSCRNAGDDCTVCPCELDNWSTATASTARASRWVELSRRACSLHRTPLVPTETPDAASNGTSYYYENAFTWSSSTSSPKSDPIYQSFSSF